MKIPKATEEYIEAQKHNSAESTVQNYTYRLKQFLEFCERAGLEETEELDGRKIEKYKRDRVERDDVNPVTLQQQMRTFRHFIKWCEANELVDDGLADRMIIPGTTPEQRVRNDALDTERAENIIEYLVKFEWATKPHLVFHILWETGMRLGCLRALDVDDWCPGEPGYLVARHRPRTGTPLKLKEEGERHITVTDERLADALDDYIAQRRPDVTDDYGREPLLATEYGRPSKGTLRETIYKVVQPCRYSGECPHGEEIEVCSMRKHGQRSKCPSSVYPHAIRSGAITEHLNQDVPKEIVSERTNVSQRVLDRHYDERSEEEKRERRLNHL